VVADASQMARPRAQQASISPELGLKMNKSDGMDVSTYTAVDGIGP
jgi:hypothetical protein